MNSLGGTLSRIVAVIGVLAVPQAGCSTGPAAPPSDASATITITSTGVSPGEVRVPFGSRVRFVNNDTRPHAITSDPIDLHTDCPAINEVGTIAAGQSGTTGRLENIRTCGFHDHNNESDPTWRGRIIVQ